MSEGGGASTDSTGDVSWSKGVEAKEAKAVIPSLADLSPREAGKVKKESPKRIVRTRWLDVWKAVDECQNHPLGCQVSEYLVTKSRWANPDLQCPID